MAEVATAVVEMVVERLEVAEAAMVALVIVETVVVAMVEKPAWEQRAVVLAGLAGMVVVEARVVVAGATAVAPAVVEAD